MISMSQPKYSLTFFFLLFIQTSLFAQELYLKIEGFNKKQDTTIDSLGYTKTHTDFNSLETEIKTFQDLLNSKGYIEHILLNFKRYNDSTYKATFNIGKQYKTIKIFFEDDIDPNILNNISNSIAKNHFEIPITEVENALNLINNRIANFGDPFSSVQLKNISTDTNNTLKANLAVSSNRKRYIDKILIKGYDKFPISYLKHYLNIKTRQPFNLNEIKQKMQDLENLAFASKIKDPEVLFTKDSTVLYIYVQKNKSNIFDGFLGFGTNAETNKLVFDGYLNLNLVNNLNYGESLKVNYKSDENEQRSFDINTKLPYLFKTPLGLNLNLNIFKKDSSFITVSQSAKLFYKINPRNQIGLGINSSKSNMLSEENYLINTSDFKSNFYTLDYLHTTTQTFNNLFPLNFMLNLNIGIGSRTTNQINEQQSRFKLNTFKIFNLNDRNSFFIGIDAAYLKSKTLLENELFRFGGINSIRGFEENILTANSFSVVKTEYRHQLSTNLYIHSVVDAAYFENNISSIDEKIFGLGFGFGLLTKAGLFKLSYASGKTEHQSFKLSNSKLHISLSSVF